MSGVPLLTSDFGSFPEINRHGITGYRCATVGEFIVAAREIGGLSRRTCREIAGRSYSASAVAPLLQHYFDRLFALHNGQSGVAWFDTARLQSITHM